MAKPHVISLAGTRFVADISGAILAPDFEAMIVADLHLEHGASLARRGIAVPPYDTDVTLTQLEELLARVDIQTLYFLGDSFHDASALSRMSADVLHRVRAITNRFATIWIDGNHDPAPKDAAGGISVAEIQLGPITLRHEPKRLDADDFEISGHLHPGAAIAWRGAMVRGKCFISDKNRIILPAFGAYTGGMSVHSKPFNGLFDREHTQVHLVARNGLHAFPIKKTS